jgi:hypothetical protein
MDVPKLNLQELFGFLTNLGDELYAGTISRAKLSHHQEQITVSWRKCSDKVAMVVLYPDQDALAFSPMIKQFSPHQKWTVIESANTRGKAIISRHWPTEGNELANEHLFRVICKRPLRLPPLST